MIGMFVKIKALVCADKMGQEFAAISTRLAEHVEQKQKEQKEKEAKDEEFPFY